MFQKKFIDCFVDVASRYSENNALCINETFYTYRELWDVVSKIRTLLRNLNSDNNRLGLLVHDDMETYASILALWLEGKAYVPMHPKYPVERNIDIATQAELNHVLDSKPNVNLEPFMVVNTHEFKTLQPTTEILSIPDDGLAYILFTSGSTGKPKGVQISYGNLGSFIDAFMNLGFKVDHNDRCLQSFDLTFDMSVQSFMIPFVHGACAYTVPHDQIKYSYAFGLLDDHELTFGVFTPSMIRLFKPYFDEIDLPSLRYCVFAGEPSYTEIVREWAKCIPNCRIFNLYGPTETTIYCTYYEVLFDKYVKDHDGIIAIGKFFNNSYGLILDDELNEVDTEVKGELWIAGGQVTPGYWNNPERNKDSFATLDYEGEQKRFYKTGDLFKLDKEGDLISLGRIDGQVKVQGFRIELGEIEVHARSFINDNEVMAFVYKSASGNNEIALCLEIDSFDEKAIVSYLGGKLAHYMIPTKIFNIDKFPLNSSDKVDKSAIKEIFKNF